MAPRGYLVCLALLVVRCVGQSITATNRTENDAEAMDIFLYSPGGGGGLDKRAPILPLTDDIRDMESIDLTGSVFRTDTSNQVDLMPFDIAVISCDASDYPGNLNAASVFDRAVGRNVSAILFYTRVSDYCSFNDSGSSDYSRVFSLQSASDAEEVLGDIPRGSKDLAAPRWTIGDADLGDDDDSGRPNYSTGIQGTGQSQRQGDDDDNDDRGLGPRPSTAVAMIILYTITGIITALFLSIIVTGAVRAHRHPERYGPRRMLGMPRQSRAKGLGRAIVDTIPIVKVGQRGQHDKPAEDVELGERNAESGTARDPDATPAAEGDSDGNTTGTAAAVAGTTSSNNHDHDHGNEHNHDHSTSPPTEADPDRHQGCSICTEDFVEGQDQRVLPCDHRYHPECIDPWLLNVSSTCPLCRIDLRPRNVDADGNPIEGDAEGPSEGQEGGLAPPVGQGAEEGRRSVRRSLVAGVLGIGGGARMDRMSGEERVAVLRRYRAQQAARRSREAGSGNGEAAGASADAEGDGGEGARARLRNLFSRRGIRTRPSGQPAGGTTVEASGANGGGAAAATPADDPNVSRT